MPNKQTPINKEKIGKRINRYFSEHTTRVIIIFVFVISFFLVLFGLWIYTVTFLFPKEPEAADIIQKRLKVDAKQYQEVITLLQKRQETKVPNISKDPFKQN